MSDEVLLALCKRAPQTVEDFRAVRGTEQLSARDVEVALDAIARGRRCPQENLPSIGRAHRAPAPELESVIDLMYALIRLVSERSGVATSLIVSRDGLLDYIERNTDGFRVLVRDAPSDRAAGSFSSVMGDVATSVEHIIAEQFKRSDFDTTWSPLYAQMLVGLIAQVGQWWLDDRRMKKDEVAAHVVNLIWNGQRGLRPHPTATAGARARDADFSFFPYDEAVAGNPSHGLVNE